MSTGLLCINSGLQLKSYKVEILFKEEFLEECKENKKDKIKDIKGIWILWHFQLQQTFRSDQSLSRVRLFATPWITARQAPLSITNIPNF